VTAASVIPISADLVSESVEEFQESLTERLSRGPLPLEETLRYATEIATCLRDLHRHGLAYGAVCSQLILLGPSGASLRQTGGLTHLGDGHCDVTAFGAVLEEILGGTDGPDDFCREIRALAMCCRDQAPEMRHVPIVLRLMALRARQSAMAPREPVRVRRPEPARLRLHLSLHWRPLANLAALALSGK
jgi:hypothetical protein